MCGVCGCDDGQVIVEERAHSAPLVHSHGYENHGNHHPHGFEAHDHDALDRPHGEDQASVSRRRASSNEERMVKIERDILSKNDAFARDNRRAFASRGLFAVNVVSSPGSGKTTLLVKVIEALNGRMPLAVIEGDQQTSNDADRIRATGAPAIQINTGKGCHLDAHMVGHALETLAPESGAVLFIENVGNLVCPAAFDLGEARRVVVFSATEGEDKPLKYPDMFASADLMVLNKADLLPHLDFDLGRCLANALRINPNLQTLIVSAKTGEGIPAFAAWVEASAARHVAALMKS
ncbi:MAG TPA: hydrogenase nickel incorporation protein HypB [Roseiarcus sp.]|nr:hydrogenase nickel incorporation protein HypB [Roseiarcus sp.]